MESIFKLKNVEKMTYCKLDGNCVVTCIGRVQAADPIELEQSLKICTVVLSKVCYYLPEDRKLSLSQPYFCSFSIFPFFFISE